VLVIPFSWAAVGRIDVALLRMSHNSKLRSHIFVSHIKPEAGATAGLNEARFLSAWSGSCLVATTEGKNLMERKLLLALITCAGLSLASANLVFAEDTTAPAPDSGASSDGTGGGSGQTQPDSGDAQK
jgi:hypothetical protein